MASHVYQCNKIKRTVNDEAKIRAHWPGAGSTKEKTRSGNDGGEDDDAAQPSHKRRRVTATI
ncbi:hypothetical protein GQ600_13703 [Phytophthora cactorum]|nr:hypothetical protein GQ600_13703 [Phytophthora cactorum]